MTDRRTDRPLGAAGLLLEPGMLDGLRLAWRLFRDPRVTSRLKTAIPALAALYLLMPIDPIPDLLLGVGQLDDLSVLGIALLLMTRLLPKLAPADVVDEHLADMGLVGQRGATQDAGFARDRVVDATFRVHE